MKFRVEMEAQNGKVKREYVIEASNGEELSNHLAHAKPFMKTNDVSFYSDDSN